MTMTVNLGDALERSVEDLVANGRYGSRSEVLREGVRLVEEREQQFAKLKRMIDEGLADVEAGRVYPVEEVRAQRRERLAARLSQAIAAE